MSHDTYGGWGGKNEWRTVRVWFSAVMASLGILGMLSLGAADEHSMNDQIISLDTFDTDQPLSFPKQWAVRGDEATAKAVYSVVEEDGNRFLRAYADKQDVQIGISRL